MKELRHSETELRHAATQPFDAALGPLPYTPIATHSTNPWPLPLATHQYTALRLHTHTSTQPPARPFAAHHNPGLD
ncbi:hypothetical protein Pcinc_031306 [Petrolisthes cinctipes]|uniref:Uncharacterized protein n=1 Tax=Petrolisthes cinctipes TaxID=88211 RepID=A0AAE1K2T8_PETCI|nr:hypothetical protein Pcinc_031306 [Petrolisthes cinctipes]